MSVFRDLVNIWKSEDNLSQAWSESNDMLHLSHEMFNDAVEALRSGEKNKVLKSIKLRDEKINDYHREIRKKVVAKIIKNVEAKIKDYFNLNIKQLSLVINKVEEC